MKIRKIDIKNFRSIKDVSLVLNNLTVLVGSNGVGKSNILKAIEAFYNAGYSYTEEDFFNKEVDNAIEIFITFSNLNENETEEFKKYIQNNELVVEKEIKWDGNKAICKYYGQTKKIIEFAEIKEAKKEQAIEKYNEIRHKYVLPEVKKNCTKKEIEENLDRFESDNPDLLKPTKEEGQFLGFTNVASGDLSKYTKWIIVKAIHDISEDTKDSGKAVFNKILDLVIRDSFKNSEDYKEFQSKKSEEYKVLVEEKVPLSAISDNISNILHQYIPDINVNLNWDEKAFKIELPNASITIEENSYKGNINNQGSGLQRALLISLLQFYAKAAEKHKNQDHKDITNEQNNTVRIIMAIEEPEIYQHPSMQRHFYKILSEISSSDNGFQIIYTTHSPLFVALDNFECINRITKEEGTIPKSTCIKKTSLDEVAEAIGQAYERSDFTGTSLKPKVKKIMTPLTNEGFFAEKVVLVEGEGDVGFLLGLCDNFDKHNISIIPCLGKNNINKPAIIFQKLGIKVYGIWDNDSEEKREIEKNKKNNRALQKIFNEVNITDFPSGIFKTYTVFQDKLETFLKDLLKENYEIICNEIKTEYGCDQKDITKDTLLMKEFVLKAKSKGVNLEECEKIISKIINL